MIHEDIIIDALSNDDEEPELVNASPTEEDLAVFSAAEDRKTNNEESTSDRTPGNLESVVSDDYISDAIPVSDSEDDESDDDSFDTEVERIFLYSAPPLRIGSVTSFRQHSMQCVRNI